MASINASTSGAGGVITTADATGILQLQAAGTTIATISSTGLTLNTGNITLPSGAAPAFSVYKASGVQTVTANVLTKVTWNNELFDTNNNFASSTFTPTVAGYYQVNACIVTAGNTQLTFYKNGSLYQYVGVASTNAYAVGSTIIYCNGSTDYIEVYASSTSTTIYANQTETWFNGSMIRSA
jgi:hypothetical protein